MIISMGSDHAGFEQKQQLVDYLRGEGYEVADLGPFSADRVDYPDFAAKVAQHVAEGKSRFGVLVCGTGIGMAIAANKICGIRAANAINVEFAKLSRGHNDANVITLSGRYVDLETNEKILDAFLTAEFEGGRHAQRVEKIMLLEECTAE